jgi:hypothetical protein
MVAALGAQLALRGRPASSELLGIDSSLPITEIVMSL